jgi:hypothetical protein
MREACSTADMRYRRNISVGKPKETENSILAIDDRIISKDLLKRIGHKSVVLDTNGTIKDQTGGSCYMVTNHRIP